MTKKNTTIAIIKIIKTINAMIAIMTIMQMMTIITFFGIVIGFECRDQCTVEWLQSSVCVCRSWKKEWNSSVPDGIRRDHEGSSLGSWQGQSCDSCKTFSWCPSTKQLKRTKWPSRLADSCGNSAVPTSSKELEPTKIITIINSMTIIVKCIMTHVSVYQGTRLQPSYGLGPWSTRPTN